MTKLIRKYQCLCKSLRLFVGEPVIGTNQPNLFVRILGSHEEPMTSEIRATRLEDISDLEILATHITSSSVHDLLSLDSSMGQVALALCNVRRSQQLWAMASMNENSVHFGEASLGILARKTGATIRLFQSTPMHARLRANVNGTCYQDIPIRLEFWMYLPTQSAWSSCQPRLR